MSWEKRIGSKVKRLRAMKGLTQEDLARRLGVTKTQVHRYESGKQAFRTAVVTKIADALGVEPSGLWTETPPDGDDAALSFRAPGKLGDALEHEGFRNVMKRAAALYLHRRGAFESVVKAIREAEDHSPAE